MSNLWIQKYIEDNFDIKGLEEIGLLKKGISLDQIEKRICEFFGIKTIFEYGFIMKEKVKEVKAQLKTFSKN